MVRASGGSAAGRFALGQDLTGTSLFKHFSDSRNSIFEFKDAQDPHTLLMALRKVHGYPLWVSVGVRKADVLQPSLESLEWNALHGRALHHDHSRRHGADFPQRNRREAEVGTAQAHA